MEAVGNFGVFESARSLDFDAPVPLVRLVRARLGAEALPSISAAVSQALEGARGRVRPGMTVAVTAGSRGIHDLVPILRGCIDWLRDDCGAEPFVVPAMGSHGGATAAGQVELLASLGVTAAAVGAPIRATMDTVVVDRTSAGIDIHVDALAWEADAVLAVNRVKPHTDFRAEAESGLAKILTVGLGKQAGAVNMHALGPSALAVSISDAAHRLVETGKVLGGVGIVENSEGQTAEIAFLEPRDIAGPGELRLLTHARRLMGRIPFDNLDVLVVDEMGKDKSGTGLDTNVIGRTWVHGIPEGDTPDIAVITVHDLTDASHGNAVGIGLADVIPFRLLQKIDLNAMYINAQAAGEAGVRRAKLPIALATDRAAIGNALRMCGRPDPSTVRLVRIPDTQTTSVLLVSQPLWNEVEQSDELEMIGEPQPFTFDQAGALTPWRDLF